MGYFPYRVNSLPYGYRRRWTPPQGLEPFSANKIDTPDRQNMTDRRVERNELEVRQVLDESLEGNPPVIGLERLGRPPRLHCRHRTYNQRHPSAPPDANHPRHTPSQIRAPATDHHLMTVCHLPEPTRQACTGTAQPGTAHIPQQWSSIPAPYPTRRPANMIRTQHPERFAAQDPGPFLARGPCHLHSAGRLSVRSDPGTRSWPTGFRSRRTRSGSPYRIWKRCSVAGRFLVARLVVVNG